VHKQPLTVKAYHEGRVQPHSAELMQASKSKLLEMALKDKERMMLEESRNKVESYIYRIKNSLEDNADAISQVTTEEQREEVRKLAVDAEEWLYEDGYSADFATMEDKYAELSVPFEKILLRMSEMTARPAAVAALKKKLTDIEQLMVKWESDRPQVKDEERASVLEKVEEIRKWVVDMEEAQAKKKPHEDAAFISDDVPGQTASVEALVLRLSKRPKPKPPKEEKNTTANESNTTTEEGDSNATESGGEKSNENDGDKSNEDEGGAKTEDGEAAKGEEEEDEL